VSTLVLRALHLWQSTTGRPLPSCVRLQVDGVFHNWGQTTFGFSSYLVRERIVNEFLVARSPIGFTHDDIDGVFGVLRIFLGDKSWNTVEEFIILIKKCFASEFSVLHDQSLNSRYVYSTFAGTGLPVFVNIISDVFDITGWINPSLNKSLTRFHRHGQDRNERAAGERQIIWMYYIENGTPRIRPFLRYPLEE
jgi:hypothetical protein